MLSKLYGAIWSVIISQEGGPRLTLSVLFLNRYYASYVVSNLTQTFPNVQLRDDYWRAIRVANKDDFEKA